jgi:hypothetical protein
MATIKIPSSKIYGVGDNSALISKNQIQKVETMSNSYARGYSNNVLVKEYNINFFEAVSPNAVEYIGDVPEKTDIVFSAKPEWQGDFMILRTNSMVDLEIAKNIRLVTLSNNGEYVDYTASVERKWFQAIGNYDTEGWAYNPIYNSDKNSFQINIADSYGEGDFLPTDYIIIGQKRVEEPVKYVLGIKIRISGAYYDQEQVSQIFGDANSLNSITIPRNELNIIGSKIDVDNAQQIIANNIIRKYGKGKEVYTIKCSVGEYYDIYGAKAIDPYDTNYPATFEKHEIVEPYVFTSQGEVPLSEKADGTPKRFEIIGIDFSYKGVVWQELTLQEYIE